MTIDSFASMSKPIVKAQVVDLFCGIGGLSHGLLQEGFKVIAGVDNEVACKFGYEHNNKAKFLHRDIFDLSASEIKQIFGKCKASKRILVGCAPCQSFSRLNSGKAANNQEEPLDKFGQLILASNPDIAFMENVSDLAKKDKYPVFERFVNALGNKYYIHYEIVDLSKYGVPQSRKRLCLFASKYAKIQLINPTHQDVKVTVRDVIGELEPIKSGEVSKLDSLHRARQLSSTNLERIKSTPHNGGSSKSWDDKLVLNCHKLGSGKTYRHSVYGRMRWDDVAPTMTTQCIGLGNGRFGHPEQDRAISLREAAKFQTFPDDYKFTSPNSPVSVAQIAKFIGNAVPVRFASVVGKSIKNHIEEYA